MNPELILDALSIFLGIIIEATPFILLGSIVSALLGRYLTPARLQKMLPNNRIGKHFAMSMTGMFFPVCECGNVPVAKRFLTSGVGSGASVSFLLGAPILNPIVIVTTIVAFPNMPHMWWGRVLGGLLIATATGYLLSFINNKKQEAVLAKNKGGHHHCHSHSHSGLGSMVDGVGSEFVTMMSIMAIGAAIAATMQTFIPREVLMLVFNGPLAGILLMMLLAFIVSICSTTDAFFSLAYAHMFSPSALLAFLVFGPMVDIKSILMMRTIYSNSFLLVMVSVITVQVIAWALLFHYLVF